MALNVEGFPTFVLAKIGTIEIDAVIRERHQYDSEITENPVEDGTIFSDHVVLLPVSYEMQGRVTDASLSLLDLRLAGRADDAFRELVTLQRSREPFDVVTGINTYSNMLFQSIGFPRESSDGRSIRFEAVMREILIVGDQAATNRDRIAADVQHSALPFDSKGVVPKTEIV